MHKYVKTVISILQKKFYNKPNFMVSTHAHFSKVLQHDIEVCDNPNFLFYSYSCKENNFDFNGLIQSDWLHTVTTIFNSE